MALACFTFDTDTENWFNLGFAPANWVDNPDHTGNSGGSLCVSPVNEAIGLNYFDPVGINGVFEFEFWVWGVAGTELEVTFDANILGWYEIQNSGVWEYVSFFPFSLHRDSFR